MSDQPSPIRSYQRVFRPDRRIFAIDGRTLPVPGGIPLRWLGTALGALAVVLVLMTRSPVALLLAGAGAAWGTVALDRRQWALAGFVLAVLACVAVGAVLGAMAWPLRLVVLPALVATVAVQVTPDGRPVHRYLWSRLAVHVSCRRSLGLPCEGRRSRPVSVHVAHDEHAPELRRARVEGPATVRFREPVIVRRHGSVRVVRPVVDARGRARRGMLVDRVALGDRDRLVVRP